MEKEERKWKALKKETFPVSDLELGNGFIWGRIRTKQRRSGFWRAVLVAIDAQPVHSRKNYQTKCSKA